MYINTFDDKSLIKRTQYLLLIMCAYSCLFFQTDAFAKIYEVSDKAVKVLSPENKSVPTEKKISSLQQLIDGNILKAGDIVQLKSGNYNILKIVNLKNKDMISIVAAKGETPKFSQVSISASENWILQGLEISSSHMENYNKFGTLISISAGSKNITVEKSRLSSVTDATKWSNENWKQLASNGIIVKDSSHITVRANMIRNINHGIFIDAGHSLIEQNTISNFSGKAISGAGDFSIYQNNTIQNCHTGGRGKVGGLIFWQNAAPSKKETPVSEGGILRGNKIINNEALNSESLCNLVGIRLSGGIFSKWVIENNLVIPMHWSGISVDGARDVVVMHNTVFNPYTKNPKAAQISVRMHKGDKAPSKGNVIINNISQGFSRSHLGTIVIGNLKVNNGNNFFQDYKKLDFRLKRGSRAVNAAITARYFAALSKIPFPQLPDKDVSGTHRPQGPGRDIGAFEMLEK